jgi:hypothetical protein
MVFIPDFLGKADPNYLLPPRVMIRFSCAQNNFHSCHALAKPRERGQRSHRNKVLG